MGHAWYDHDNKPELTSLPKKRTISLTDPIDARLIRIYKGLESNPSDVVEAALSHFFRLEETEIGRQLKIVSLEKQTLTEPGWRRIFWLTLCHRLGYTEYRYESRRPYGPVTLGQFTVVFLLPNSRGTEDGTLAVHVFQMPDQGSRVGENSLTLHYLLGDSVGDAVNEIIQWTDSHGSAYASEARPNKSR